MPTCQGSHQPPAASDPPRGAPDFREEGAQGDDIERGTQRAGFGSLGAGELPIPLATIVYNTDLGLIEYLGTHTTPEVPLGRVVRITIALPPFIEAVKVRGHLYVDGGVVELLPSRCSIMVPSIMSSVSTSCCPSA
jgi:hypothetical protein